MPSKLVILVVISFLLVMLIYGPTSTFNVFALKKTSTTCTKNKSSKYANAYTCCYSTTNEQTGVVHDYCADCFAQSGGFACGDFVQTFRKG